MEPVAQERRKSKRYRKDMAGGWLRLLSEDPSKDGWHPSFVRNISKGGLCFDLAGPVALADQMQFKTQVELTLEPIRCKGAVVRLRPLEGAHKTEVGICFTVIDDKDADLIDTLAWGQSD